MPFIHEKFLIKIAGFFTLFLLLLLPYHAFFVTWISSFFHDSHFLSVLPAWKECIIIILAVILGIQCYLRKSLPFTFVLFDYFFFAFLSYALILGVFLQQDFSQIIWGLKYDFEFWILFYIVRGLFYHTSFRHIFYNVFFINILGVVSIGFLLYFILPHDIMQYFGYTNNISSFSVNQSLPMFHILGDSEIVRAASTFSGPNQFGFYLMICISFLLLWLQKIYDIKIFHHWKNHQPQLKKLLTGGIMMVSALTLLFVSFSRSAWLGIIMVIVLFILLRIPQKMMRYILQGGIVFTILSILLIQVFFSSLFQNALVRSASSSLHLEKSMQGISQVLQNPFGTGLGTAGPASLRFEELHTVYIPKEKVEALFLDGLHIQQRNAIWLYDEEPIAKVAFKSKNIDELYNIPLLQGIQKNKPVLFQKIIDLWDIYYIERIAENWHIQMFQEFGWLGGGLYILFLLSFLKYLFLYAKNNIKDSYAFLGLFTLSAFIISGMFLHVFEDAASSLTLAIILGVLFYSKENSKRS
jgi:hypothetical protein